MNKLKETFNIGDRVCPRHLDHVGSVHGVVVYYQGKHDPRNPRVRFNEGWGVSPKAGTLRLLTKEECAELPVPDLYEADTKQP